MLLLGFLLFLYSWLLCPLQHTNLCPLAKNRNNNICLKGKDVALKVRPSSFPRHRSNNNNNNNSSSSSSSTSSSSSSSSKSSSSNSSSSSSSKK